MFLLNVHITSYLNKILSKQFSKIFINDFPVYIEYMYIRVNVSNYSNRWELKIWIECCTYVNQDCIHIAIQYQVGNTKFAWWTWWVHNVSRMTVISIANIYFVISLCMLPQRVQELINDSAVHSLLQNMCCMFTPLRVLLITLL